MDTGAYFRLEPFSQVVKPFSSPETNPDALRFAFSSEQHVERFEYTDATAQQIRQQMKLTLVNYTCGVREGPKPCQLELLLPSAMGGMGAALPFAYMYVDSDQSGIPTLTGSIPGSGSTLNYDDGTLQGGIPLWISRASQTQSGSWNSTKTFKVEISFTQFRNIMAAMTASLSGIPLSRDGKTINPDAADCTRYFGSRCAEPTVWQLVALGASQEVYNKAFLTNAAAIGGYVSSLDVVALPDYASPDVSYEGLWLNGGESGWGVNLTHQGAILFATWFTYDRDGSGMWLVMSNGRQTGPGSFSGTLYRTVGPAFSATPFRAITFPENYVEVGTVSFSFDDANRGTMSYLVDGVAQTKPITRFVYAATGTTCSLAAIQGASPNYQDLWISAAGEGGWGINVTHQGDVLFATWFTYAPGDGDANKGMWLVMSDGKLVAPGTYSGALQRTTGPAFDSLPFDASKVVRTTVGSATLSFYGADDGTFSYTVDGVSQAKPIKRYIYASPATVCW
jgi:hypothetical protein